MLHYFLLAYCDSGYEQENLTCEACEIGYYKNNTNGFFESCWLCPIEYITEGEISISLDNCTVGQSY